MYAALKDAALKLYRRDPVLMTFGLFTALGTVVLSVPLAFDTREVLGLNPWIKPIKFSASFGLFFVTLGWLLSYLPGPSRQKSIISWVTGLCIFIEAPLITLQAGRGVTSHFNTDTLFDFVVYGVTGFGAFTQAAMVAWTLVLFCTRKVDLPRLPLAGVQAGLALWLVGILPAITMVAIGHHNVGIADGGPGLPLFNWSTLGGDLRIAHFLGLHAMQILPVAGFLLYRLQNTISPRGGQIAFTLLTAVYLMTVVGTFAQAMAGLPLIALN